MANQGIDFLQASRQETVKSIQQKKTLLRLSAILLAVYCLAAAGVMAFSFYLSQESQRLDQEIIASKAKIDSFKQTEVLQALLKQRLAAVEKISLQKTLDYRQIVALFGQVTPPGLNISSYTFSPHGDLTLNAQAINSLVADDFLSKLKKLPESKQRFPNIVLKGFSRDADGTYKIDLSLSLE